MVAACARRREGLLAGCPSEQIIVNEMRSDQRSKNPIRGVEFIQTHIFLLHRNMSEIVAVILFYNQQHISCQ